MPTDFIQYLVIVLIALLFGKEYLLTPLLKKWGIVINGKNGDKNINELLQKHEERLDIANNEMSDVKISLARIEVNVENIKESQDRQEKAINNIYHKLENA